MSIAIYDNFNDPQGQFPDYDTYDPAQRVQLANQRHVDIRSFEQITMGEGYTMFDMDALDMTELDALTMGQLENEFIVQDGENWTNGVVGPQADRDNFNGISLPCDVGETDTSSVMVDLVNISAFATPDYISLSLPQFPIGDLTLGSSYISFSPDAFADTICSLPFSAFVFVQYASTGDYEARIPASLVTGIDSTRINAVRFRIVATAACTFRCLAIRALSATWEFAPMDCNTLYPRIGATVPPSGSLSQPHTFPLDTTTGEGFTWPILMRSDGTLGPTMVDVDLGVTIETGSNLAANSLTVYMRELPMIWTTMEAMDSYTMAELEALQQMPDWSPAPLDDFAHTQFTTVELQWGTTTQLVITDSITGQSYTYPVSLQTQTRYYLLIQLEDDSLQVRIFPQSLLGLIDWGQPVFDSTTIVDANFNRRRRGRLGWYASLGDGDTYVKEYRPRRLVYGEYRSAPLASVTPVVGAQVYASSTPDEELYDGAVATAGAIVSPDVVKSNSGHSLQVQCDGLVPLEGLTTAPVTFDSMIDAIVSFDVLAPIAAKLAAVLRGEGRTIVLNMVPFPTNHWTHIEIDLDPIGQEVIPGTYSLWLVQMQTGANTFYIDNLSIRQQSVSWQGRVPAADPWNMNNPPWIKFRDEINDPYSGALLGRGNTLQIRGQSVSQLGFIDRVKIIPKYATLGNFVWSDQAPSYPEPPVPSFIYAENVFTPNMVTFDGSATTFASTGSWYWNFGDGEYGVGEIVTHQYASTAMDYIVTLTAIDDLNQQVSETQTIVVAQDVEIFIPYANAEANAPLPTL